MSNDTEFTYRNLTLVVFDSFAISTRELADHFGVDLAKVRNALDAYDGSVFCGDMEETEGGVTDRRSGNRSHRDGGGYGAIVWQCYKTYDDHTIEDNYQDLTKQGVDLDAVIRG
jgi:hypothetical protein